MMFKIKSRTRGREAAIGATRSSVKFILSQRRVPAIVSNSAIDAPYNRHRAVVHRVSSFSSLSTLHFRLWILREVVYQILNKSVETK